MAQVRSLDLITFSSTISADLIIANLIISADQRTLGGTWRARKTLQQKFAARFALHAQEICSYMYEVASIVAGDDSSFHIVYAKRPAFLQHVLKHFLSL